MKSHATLIGLLLAAIAAPAFAHEHNDCAERAKQVAPAERKAFTKQCLEDFAKPEHVAKMKQHDKEQHCDTNAKSMKLEGDAKHEYLEHCYHEDDFDKNSKPHPKH